MNAADTTTRYYIFHLCIIFLSFKQVCFPICFAIDEKDIFSRAECNTLHRECSLRIALTLFRHGPLTSLSFVFHVKQVNRSMKATKEGMVSDAGVPLYCCNNLRQLQLSLGLLLVVDQEDSLTFFSHGEQLKLIRRAPFNHSNFRLQVHYTNHFS